MYELTVRVLRAVASRPRLRILAYLSRHQEVAPTELANELGMGFSLVSSHLAKLTSAGLLQRRRSGGWCYARAQSPYGDKALSGRISRWLMRILSDPVATAKRCRLERIRSVAEATKAIEECVFAAVTAFDNVRRLQIVHLLQERGPVDTDAIAEALDMSPSAVIRQSSKLVRRGYVQADRLGHRKRYWLAEDHQTPLHAELSSIVLAALEMST